MGTFVPFARKHGLWAYEQSSMGEKGWTTEVEVWGRSGGAERVFGAGAVLEGALLEAGGSGGRTVAITRREWIIRV